MGNNKAKTWESLGFAHKKGCANVLTQPRLLLYLYLNGYNMGNQTIAKYVKQMRREEGIQKRILSFLFPENVILVTLPEESVPEALFPFVIFL